MRAEGLRAESLVDSVLEGIYRIVRLVGEGGMGAVYEAVQLRINKRVAVKVMSRELASSAEAMNRFHREAMITSGLGHPHIVQVFDFSSTSNGEPFLVMEFLDGESLEHRLREVDVLSPADTVHIIKQVGSALAATHESHIVHRDLKPANIYLLTAAGVTDFVKVLDFGISKARFATTKLTAASAVMGTPNYMSPEQALGRVDEIDERTDQWALACIAWECLCGRTPFIGDNMMSILFQVVHEPPPPMPAAAAVGPEVEDVLRRALAKDSKERFASITDFVIALENAILGPSPIAVPMRDTASGRNKLAPDAVPAKAGDIVRQVTSTFVRGAGEVEAPEQSQAGPAAPIGHPPEAPAAQMPAITPLPDETASPKASAPQAGDEEARVAPVVITARTDERTSPIRHATQAEDAFVANPRGARWRTPIYAAGAVLLLVLGAILLFRSGSKRRPVSPPSTPAAPSSALSPPRPAPTHPVSPPAAVEPAPLAAPAPARDEDQAKLVPSSLPTASPAEPDEPALAPKAVESPVETGHGEGQGTPAAEAEKGSEKKVIKRPDDAQTGQRRGTRGSGEPRRKKSEERWRVD